MHEQIYQEWLARKRWRETNARHLPRPLRWVGLLIAAITSEAERIAKP